MVSLASLFLSHIETPIVRASLLTSAFANKVTLITGSGKQLRVTQGYTQGYLDSENNQIMVRMSRIVDFSKGGPERWFDILRVLSWLLAEPVGKTV